MSKGKQGRFTIDVWGDFENHPTIKAMLDRNKLPIDQFMTGLFHILQAAKKDLDKQAKQAKGEIKPGQPVLNLEQTARRLGISVRKLHQMRKAGLIPEGFVFGKRVTYTPEMLDRWREYGQPTAEKWAALEAARIKKEARRKP